MKLDDDEIKEKAKTGAILGIPFRSQDKSIVAKVGAFKKMRVP